MEQIEAETEHSQVTPQVTAVIRACAGEMTRADLQKALALNDREHFRREYLVPALNASFVEMTIPEKPRSRNQKYRLTAKGKSVLKQLYRRTFENTDAETTEK